MNNQTPSVAKTPEHLATAEDFAKTVLLNYKPFEINELLERVKHVFVEHRKAQIQEAHSVLEDLRESYERLDSPEAPAPYQTPAPLYNQTPKNLHNG